MEILSETSCRICFISCDVTDTNASDIAEVFRELMGYEIRLNDTPQKICSQCLRNLEAVKRFKETCDRSEEFLKQLRQDQEMTLEEGEIFVPKGDVVKQEEEPILTSKVAEPEKWKYQAFKEHLRKNRIEPSLVHFFIFDWEWTTQSPVPPNQDLVDYEESPTSYCKIACTFCLYKGSKKNIKRHCQTKCRKRTFRCTCTSEFYCLDLLRQHIAKEHPKTRVLYRELPCKFCQFTCCFETTMERHCKKMHQDRVSKLEKCLVCKEIFYSEDLKLQHLVFRCNKGDSSLEIPFKAIFGRRLAVESSQTPSEPFKPKQRYTMTWLYNDLKDHLRDYKIVANSAHQFVLDAESTRPEVLPPNEDLESYEDEGSDKTVVTCTYCSYKVSGYDVKKEIKEHIQTTCRKMSFRCTCSHEFYCLDLVRKHTTNRQPSKRILYRDLQCYFCQFSCSFENTMERHCKKMHTEEVTQLETCDTCEETFYCHDLKLQHLVFRCNGGDSSLEIPFKPIYTKDIPVRTKKPQVFVKVICELCGLYFNKITLKTHMEKDHQKIRYSCDLCGNSYNLKANLVKHMQKNHLCQVINFPCEQCGKVFQHWHTRFAHIRTKHATNPFPHACDLCDKRYLKKSGLVNHKATHSGKFESKKPTTPAFTSFFFST